jgi:hypothetical protein
LFVFWYHSPNFLDTPYTCDISRLRVKGLYMFQALLAYLQEVLHKQRLVYCVHVMSAGLYQDWSSM